MKVSREEPTLSEEEVKDAVALQEMMEGKTVLRTNTKVSAATQTTFFSERLVNIIEKPDPKNSPSNIAVVGRYVLTPKIFQILKKQEKGKGGEIQLTDAISKFITTEKVFSYKFFGERYDCGSKQGYLRASVSFGRKHLDEGNEFNSWLKELTF